MRPEESEIQVIHLNDPDCLRFTVEITIPLPSRARAVAGHWAFLNQSQRELIYRIKERCSGQRVLCSTHRILETRKQNH